MHSLKDNTLLCFSELTRLLSQNSWEVVMQKTNCVLFFRNYRYQYLRIHKKVVMEKNILVFFRMNEIRDKSRLSPAAVTEEHLFDLETSISKCLKRNLNSTGLTELLLRKT